MRSLILRDFDAFSVATTLYTRVHKVLFVSLSFVLHTYAKSMLIFLSASLRRVSICQLDGRRMLDNISQLL